ncbi:unnamed protein product [Pseudo-nitzschia multistriata]|uniref:Uncharacterized protein n=1 Tax=Pseudo-nitzschia multistriata TaxID=183589 RepID=A0A448ZGK9_9STRA|nr:unnamed protein product [Pseudo-nitzschia multistriata]
MFARAYNLFENKRWGQRTRLSYIETVCAVYQSSPQPSSSSSSSASALLPGSLGDAEGIETGSPSSPLGSRTCTPVELDPGEAGAVSAAESSALLRSSSDRLASNEARRLVASAMFETFRRSRTAREDANCSPSSDTSNVCCFLVCLYSSSRFED